MELKKTPKADLESKKQIFLLIALIIALSGTIFAIEYKTWDEEEEEAKKDDFIYEEEEIMIHENKNLHHLKNLHHHLQKSLKKLRLKRMKKS